MNKQKETENALWMVIILLSITLIIVIYFYVQEANHNDNQICVAKMGGIYTNLDGSTNATIAVIPNNAKGADLVNRLNMQMNPQFYGNNQKGGN